MFRSFRSPQKKFSSLATLGLILSISGCSIYRSEGRKTFESKVPTGVQTAAAYNSLKSQNCEVMSELKLDLESSFLDGPQELLLAKDKYEVWQKITVQNSVEITVIENLGSQSSVCHYTFSSLNDWNEHQASFFQTMD